MTAALMSWLGMSSSDRAERRLWANAPSVQHLAELMAWFCLGELQRWPGHSGPTDPETREANLGPVLAAANRRGFITLCSQPGIDLDAEGWQQRAAVDGLATDAVLAQLRGLVVGTRLQLIAHPASKWRRDYSRAIDATRVDGHLVTGFGGQSPARDIRFMFDGVPDQVVDQLAAMWQVAIVDPQWGAHRLLWDRLAEPDWDHPTPPQEATVPALPPEPPVGTVLQTSDDLGTYRIEHLPDGWAIQYRPGENEHGLTHTDGRISWRAAWKAWGPPSGAATFIPVPPGAPPLPALMTDASTARFDPPPAAKPYTRTTTPSGGTTMSASIQEIQGILASITAATDAGRGPIQQLIDDATRERARLQASMDGSHQSDVEAAVAMLTLLISTLEDALGYSHEAVSSVERIGQRL